MRGALRLWLDHASVMVPDLGTAIEHLDRRLGLRATRSPTAPERHSRVYLDRSYLEVSADPAAPGWAASMFFLRFDDAEALREHLDAAAIAYRFDEYEGVDGVWDDVEIRIGTVPMPTLIRRTAPAAVARDWPPALGEPHRCGARSLAAVHVEVPSPAEAADAYGRLLGIDPPRASEPGVVRVPLGSGEIVLHEGGSGAIVGIVLGVHALEATREALGPWVWGMEGDVAWLDPDTAFGLRLGITERPGRGRG